jgi:hypothetical protein
MTAAGPNLDRVPPSWGGPLTEADYAALADSWITREIADEAMLRRVDAQSGREVVGQKGSRDCAGIVFPYYWPGDPSPFDYRVRRDHPDPVQGIDGKIKLERKYLAAPGGANRLYIPPCVTLDNLADAGIPMAVVEGEKKALALSRLAYHESPTPRHIPIGISGVWNWRGKVGKTGGPAGERLDVKGPISDLARIEWKGRTVFIVFDANVHTNDSVKAARKGIARELATRGAQVKFVNLPEDCGVNGVDDLLAKWGPARVLELFEKSSSGVRLEVVSPPQFQSRPAGMFRVTKRGELLTEVQLTNYHAAVVTNVQLDDGVETKREFEVVAELMGRQSTFTISAAEFSRMDWPMEQLGPSAITYPTQREYARTAIQSFSMGAEERHIYTHTGWRKVDGLWLFLHSDGAVGGGGAVSDINVRLAGSMNSFSLPAPPVGEELVFAVRASLGLLSLGPAAISFPLLAAVVRAVFGNADFSMHLAGETGAFKSALAALYQQHFGPTMERLNLPGSWSSTGNALEILAFHGKDVLLVIDDFAPHGSANDVARYHSTADRVFRAVGNHAGRGRLDSTAKLREAKPPRALILSTGEDIPHGHSLRARLLILEVGKGAIDKTDLTERQKEAREGLYAAAMAGFVRWVASDYDAVRAKFDRRVGEARVQASQNAAHARTPEVVANLQAAFELYLDCAVNVGAIVPRGECAWQIVAGKRFRKRRLRRQNIRPRQNRRHSFCPSCARYSSPAKATLRAVTGVCRTGSPQLADGGATMDALGYQAVTALGGSPATISTWIRRPHTVWCRWRRAPQEKASQFRNRCYERGCARKACWLPPTKHTKRSQYDEPSRVHRRRCCIFCELQFCPKSQKTRAKMSGRVRQNVGWFVGKSEVPDTKSLCGISIMRSICRVCRVFIGVESPQEFGDFPRSASGAGQIIQNMGLE